MVAFEREGGEGAKHNSGTGVNRFEPALEFLKETIHIGELAEGRKPDENREKLKKIGSNFRISEKRLTFELKKPWKFLLNLNSARAENPQNLAVFLKSQKVRRGRDSNPRRFDPYRFSRPAVSTAHTPLPCRPQR